MSVRKEPSGRRSVEVQVEIPGTPEEVWRAVATGPGISSWFVPTDVEERPGGVMTFHLMPGMDSTALVTGWEPPGKLSYEERGWMENAPPLATEVFVEARSGGVCVVRMVHSLFASTDDWDNQLASMESGWPGFFRVLRLYMAHFRGQPSASIQVTGARAGPEIEAWHSLTRLLGFDAPAAGSRSTAPPNAPRFSGIVESVRITSPNPELLVRLDQPTSGIATIGAFTWNGAVHVALNCYLYGGGAAEIAARERPAWQAWMSERFPFGDPGGGMCGASQ